MIAQDEGKPIRLSPDVIERGLTIGNGEDLVAAKLESGLDGDSDSGFIIGDEYFRRIFHTFHNTRRN